MFLWVDPCWQLPLTPFPAFGRPRDPQDPGSPAWNGADRAAFPRGAQPVVKGQEQAVARTKKQRSLLGQCCGSARLPGQTLFSQEARGWPQAYPNLSLLSPHHPGGLPPVIPMTRTRVEVGWEECLQGLLAWRGRQQATDTARCSASLLLARMSPTFSPASSVPQGVQSWAAGALPAPAPDPCPGTPSRTPDCFAFPVLPMHLPRTPSPAYHCTISPDG